MTVVLPLGRKDMEEFFVKHVTHIGQICWFFSIIGDIQLKDDVLTFFKNVFLAPAFILKHEIDGD